MTKRGEQQRAFAEAFALLLNYAFHLGYKVTFPPEHLNHIENSYHFKGLAKDLNLFRDGRYLRSTKAYEPLGKYWVMLGGTWGGRWRDGCHFSWGEGKRYG